MEQSNEERGDSRLLRRWELTLHACRFCFGRVLQRSRRGVPVEVLCAECHETAPGGPLSICCCGADCGALGHALECFSNPQRSEANPQVVMVRERARGLAPQEVPLRAARQKTGAFTVRGQT
ncbi:MAG TPA: hypothetical protein VF472_07110 [Burkholderiaceae bacterium]